MARHVLHARELLGVFVGYGTCSASASTSCNRPSSGERDGGHVAHSGPGDRLSYRRQRFLVPCVHKEKMVVPTKLQTSKGCKRTSKRGIKNKMRLPPSGELKTDRIKPSGQYPKKKAKAAITRRIAEYALHLMETYATPDPTTDDYVHDQLALLVCKMLCDFY